MTELGTGQELRSWVVDGSFTWMSSRTMAGVVVVSQVLWITAAGRESGIISMYDKGNWRAGV